QRFVSLRCPEPVEGSKGRTADWGGARGGRAGHKPRPTEWSLTENAEFHLPTSIKAILTARLDRLPANIKEVVKVAAVQGQEFELQILTEVLRTEILPEVEGAVHEQVWASLSEMRYIFKHALLREAAYEMQLRTRLRTLHRQTAKAIEQLHAANLTPYVADLVYHYRSSQDVEQERHYAILAGKHAAAHFANQEALRYFSRALELTAEDDLMARLDLLLNREKVYHLQGERDAQKQELGTLESLARQLQDNERLSEVYLCLACYAEAIGDAPAVIASAKEAIRLAQAIADKAKVAAGYTWWGQVLWPEGHHEEAREKFLLALPLYREVGDQWGEGDALNNLGIVAFQQGDNLAAKDYYEQALQIRQATNDQRGKSTSLSNLGLVLHKLGDYVGAIDYYDQSWQIKRAIGDLRGEGITLLNLGFTSQAQGNHTSALSYNKQALAILREIDDRRHETIVLLNMALLSHHLGDNQSAHQYAQEVLTISEELESRYLAGYAFTFQGHARVGLGHLKEAHSAYQQAHTLWQEMQLPDLAIEALAGLARVKLLEGKAQKAQHDIHEILPYLEKNPTLSGAEEPLRVYLTCYHVLRANKKPASHSNNNASRAKKTLQTAHRLLVEWAAKINDQNSRRMFLENVPTHREIIAEWERVCDGRTDSVAQK
ncbi:MAG: ATP-binding protein, partial [Ardenticatenaceae bacterium]